MSSFFVNSARLLVVLGTPPAAAFRRRRWVFVFRDIISMLLIMAVGFYLSIIF
jgi:hypothetical protein